MTPIARLRQLVAEFLPDYLKLAEPDCAGVFDLGSVRLLGPDVPGWSCDARANAGVIGELRDCRGERLTVLVRIEKEPLTVDKTRFGQHVLDLWYHYQQPVLASVVLLQGGRPGANLFSMPIWKAAGMDLLKIYYTGFGLALARAEYYLERPEPLAWALAAAMRPVRLSRDDLRRASLERIGASDLALKRKKILSAFVRSVRCERP